MSKKKQVSEQEKEVLENIMEDLEKEAKEKEAAENKESASEEVKEETEKTEETEKPEEKEPSKKEKKDPLKEKLDELNDRLIRQVAEFDNFRKRTDREKAQMFEQGQGSVLEKLLPIVDNFERGLAAVPEDEKDGAFADGMNKIYKQLIKQLEDLGVTPIEAVGKEFDPNLHNAVMQVESEEYESGIVAQELQKGYMFHDTVLRHSMVGVNK
ncbi:molecular chaperone GrpE [Butyrivibrio proteoclasticus]|uniref:Protein GrpE n=1 Tax=Butyrivibrio proteoclasticus TaxID=43305 RepID=A0A1I5V291_9FIRM|nr:nucleotide exchange factor GrpE [Butyrivibrio proteoclasticus]SFQ01590.1 molecular chaperone GrpE [Butyrivibrio proteoclasticus]